MPNFEIQLKRNRRLEREIIPASDLEEAKMLAERKFMGSEIISVRQRGAGGDIPKPTGPVGKPQGGGMVKKIVALVVLLAIAGGAYFALKHFGIL